MKLTAEDKELILEWGFSEDDFRQIEEATKLRNTKYELLGGNGGSINRGEAISILGRDEYLSGICRSAFHWTAVREDNDGHQVYFDSSDMFKD